MRRTVVAAALAALLAPAAASPADVLRERSQQGLGFYAAEQRVPSHQRLPPSMLESDAAVAAPRPAFVEQAAFPQPPAAAAAPAPAALSTGAPSVFDAAASLPPPPGMNQLYYSGAPAAHAAPAAPAAPPALVEEGGALRAPRRSVPAGLARGPPSSMPRMPTPPSSLPPPPGSYAPHHRAAAAVHSMPAPLGNLPSYALVSTGSTVTRSVSHAGAPAARRGLGPAHRMRRAVFRRSLRDDDDEDDDDEEEGGDGEANGRMPAAPRMPHLPAPPVTAPLS